MDKKTDWLMDWNDRMIVKYGHPKYGTDWCRKLACFMGELYSYGPSDSAIKEAEKWELKNPEE